MATDRRAILAGGAALAAAAATRALAQPSGLGTGAPPSKLFRTTEIASGKVMGIANGPIWEFRGIPYGASTGGRNRYMPPKPPACALPTMSTTAMSGSTSPASAAMLPGPAAPNSLT